MPLCFSRHPVTIINSKGCAKVSYNAAMMTFCQCQTSLLSVRRYSKNANLFAFLFTYSYLCRQISIQQIMNRVIFLLVLSWSVLTASAQTNDYIVKTKGAKKTVKAAPAAAAGGGDAQQDAEPKDFMGKNFPYYSMCDWRVGMRFMVIPEKYDLLVNTFCDAETNREVGSGRLRHHILTYQGHEEAPNGRTHVLFADEGDGKKYYFELPMGSFEDYCYSRKGVPTLAYLGDVDKARELLIDQQVLTRAQKYYVDTDYDSDGSSEVTVKKNIVVTIKAIGVGTRNFPVKIIAEDEQGNQFFQCVAMSKTNCGLRDDEFIMDNEKFLFQNSFEYADAIMTVSENYNDYIGKTIHTNHPTMMRSKGSGKIRDIRIPRFTGFIVDEIKPVPDTRYYLLTMREVESRRVFTKEVAFTESDVLNTRNGNMENDFFGYVFGMGDGAVKETSKEIRAAIREGRVIRGMNRDQVLLAMGEPFRTVVEDNGNEKWMYSRSNGVIFDVWFDRETGLVVNDKARKGTDDDKKTTTTAKRKKPSPVRKASSREYTETDGDFTTGTPIQ